ncbi:MAG: hypothetical protein BroJett042_04080 [Bacteroidota bacterium]|nr:MAG: hypothetical protein BroJett042_04080 [Bacteroidota bacterium]
MKQNKYLQATLKIHAVLKGSKLSNKTIVKVKAEITLVKRLFHTSQLNAILLSSILHESLLDGDVDLRKLIEYYAVEQGLAQKLALAVEEMLEKGIIHKSMPERRNYKRVLLAPLTMEAIMKGERKRIGAKTIKTLDSFMYEVSTMLELRKKGNVIIEQFVAEINQLVTRAQHLSFVSFVRRHKLPTKEEVMLVQMAANNFNGRESDEVSELIASVADDPLELYFLQAQFRRQEIKLFKEGLVELSLGELGIDTEINLTHMVREQLFSNSSKEMDLLFKPTLCHVHSPESIQDTLLVFDDNILKEMNIIRNVLHPDKYKQVTKKLNRNNLKGGLTILFHGLPGTGKTQSVMQLAKVTKRTVLRLEISKIKTMWVGESEKNIKKVFTEYKRCKQSMAIEPILLFNEADAIFSTRRDVGSSVDQMENSVQNILLQELEEFDGILFATTNLKQNLDTAFERRFLYKVDFTMPSKTARLEMLKFNFPELDERELSVIVNEVEFTGSAIENIKRKIILSQLFNNRKKITTSLLYAWLVEESNAFGKNAIGFKRGH